MPDKDPKKSSREQVKGDPRKKDGKSEPAAARKRSEDDGETVAQVAAQEFAQLCKDCLGTHGSWLHQPLLGLHELTHVSLPILLAYVLAFLFILLFISPVPWIPFIAFPVVPLIPAINTINALSQARRSKGRVDGQDGAQYLLLWVGWALISWSGAWVRVYRPGWIGMWEIGRVGAGIVLGGPWMGRAALKATEPSSRMQKAQKHEAALAAQSSKPEKEEKERPEKRNPSKASEAREETPEERRRRKEKEKAKEKKAEK